MRTLNLGILAHVDAGKTSLTERLLYAAGVIGAIGSVDDGSTQTDTLALERQRGITIKAAVVSFAIRDLTVNLIDTPGHPDFIAEVERVLGVLDGAVLVVSAVEGVQAQTRILFRALRRLRIPMLLFVNKIDRAGADLARVLGELRRLTPDLATMTSTQREGTPGAAAVPHELAGALTELIAGHDDDFLSACLAGVRATEPELRARLAALTGRARVHPVFCGSAITGAGIDPLVTGIGELLPVASGDPSGPVAGTVFKVDRGPAGERIAYARLFAGTLRTRDRIAVPGGGDAKVTAIRVFDGGPARPSPAIEAGQLGMLWGLAGIRIGDTIGPGDPPRATAHHFAPPTLETVVVPSTPDAQGALRTALAQLAEQDPLIAVRQDDDRRELSVSLYGEVQKEVVQATLASEYGLDVRFTETTTICVERPARSGSAAQYLGKAPNPFVATVGLRVDPAPGDVSYRLGVELGCLPLAFHQAVEDAVAATLRQGLRGWAVTGCAVTLTHAGFAAPVSTAADFRNLTPMVLMAALGEAGTTVCEPLHRFALEIPGDTLAAVLPVLARIRAVPGAPTTTGSVCTLTGSVPAAEVHGLRLRIPGLTRGEGVLESAFDRYEPVTGPIPVRARSGPDPRNRKEYLLHVVRRLPDSRRAT
ncbi:MAG: GTP-binding protein [Actinomycetia bacterium]|nr:GTP-binding protein [Actinomycetes bacterium]